MGDSAKEHIHANTLAGSTGEHDALADSSAMQGEVGTISLELPHARRPLSPSEIAYLGARGALGLSFLIVYLSGEIRMVDSASARLVNIAVGLSTVTTVGVFIAMMLLRVSPRTVLKAAAVPDFIGIALAVIGSQAVGDPAYVWVIGFAIVNALLLPQYEAWALSVGVGLLYFLSYAIWATTASGPIPWPTQVVKTLGVVVLGYFTATAVNEYEVRKTQLEAHGRAIETLNNELRMRVTDLRAIADITEAMHSSLDFDVIGDEVLRIIQDTIGIEDCSIHVIDRTSGDSVIAVGPPSSAMAYLTLTESERLVVMFGVPEESISEMQSGDRYLLQAVGTELAVAAENSRLYKLTRRMSLSDELTGLHNYRYLQQRLHNEIERASRHKHDLSLLMIDIDNFKYFNDRFGHLAGDRALADLASVLRGCVRDVDVPCRFGGEEFSVILIETDIAGATIAAEKVRAAIEAHRFADANGAHVVSITVSVGVSSYPEFCSDAESLLRTADDELYRAKRAGRNQVCAP